MLPKLNEQFGAGFGIGLLTGAGGEIYGIPYKVDVKSTIWYPIKAFEAAGLRRSHDVGRDEDAGRRRSLPTATGHRGASASRTARQPAGSPPTGSRTSMLRTAGIDAYNRWITERPQVRFARGRVPLSRSSPSSGSPRATSKAATSRSRQPTASSRWIRCSRQTGTGKASRRAAGCTDSRPGLDLTSSRMRGQSCRLGRGTRSAKTSASCTSRPSTRPRASQCSVLATRSWS